MSLLSLSYPVLALAINAPAQRFKLPFRATGKTTLCELCEREPFLSQLWRPSSYLQELKGKARPPSRFNGPVISLEPPAPKKCLVPISILAEEGIGHGMLPVAEIPTSQFYPNPCEETGSDKIYLPWTADSRWQNFLLLEMKAAHILLATMLPDLRASVRSKKLLGKPFHKSCS